jgi:predicted transcriptional regulator
LSIKHKDTPTGNLPDLLPNQIERLEINLEQMRGLSSTVRADVFWSFHAIAQKSVNDIAKELGKSAQTIHYHVNALIKLELLVPGETRKKRSRTEQLYVRRARTSVDPSVGATEEYNRYRARAFKLETLITGECWSTILKSSNLPLFESTD